MYTRSKDPKAKGKFEYRIFDETGAEVGCVGGFDTAQEADRAAEIAHRNFLMPKVEIDLPEMTDEELLAALAA